MSLADIEGHGHDETDCLASRLSSCELQRDEWKQYADAGLSSYAELQAEVARLSSRLGDLLLPLRILREFAINAGFTDYETLDKAGEALSSGVVERQTPKCGQMVRNIIDNMYATCVLPEGHEGVCVEADRNRS